MYVEEEEEELVEVRKQEVSAAKAPWMRVFYWMLIDQLM